MSPTHKSAGAVALVCLAAWAASMAAQERQPTTAPAFSGLFHAPRAAADQDGKPILTRRAVGHPVVVDFNADGKNDILLGCHRSMDTAAAQILVLLNVGTGGEMRFRWPTRKTIQLEGKAPLGAGEAAPLSLRPRPFSASCGCKSSGTFELHPTDYNGDGHFDLLVNTYWTTDGVRVLLNTAKSRQDPTFLKGEVLHRIGSHGKGSGGGDWNQDGIADLVFPVNAYEWAVYPGQKGAAGGVSFAARPAFGHEAFRIVGQSGWFDHSPYAWNFSGRHAPGSKITEIVAVMEDPDNAKRQYSEHLCHVNYYWLDHAAKTCTLKGRLATNQAAHTRLGIGDLNGDGRMDLLYTGGAFSRGEETKIWVMYGKVRNVPARPAGADTKAGGGGLKERAGP